MLIKLLKYDLKYMLKNMMVFYVLSLFFAVTTRIFFLLGDSAMMQILLQISMGGLFAMIANILLNSLMRSWVRFKESIFKDESYLTHTLPVTKNNIYDSKMIQSLVFFVVGFAVIVIDLIIAFFSKERWQLVKNFVNNMTSGTYFVIVIFVLLFLELYNALQCGYLGMILGYGKNRAKSGFSALFGFIAYILSQSVVILSVFVFALFNSSIMDFFKNNANPSPDAFKLLSVFVIIIYLIIVRIMSLVSKKIFNRGVNIE